MNYTDISTRRWRYIFNAVIYLHYEDINDHLLRRYTFAVVSASSDVTERQSSAQPGRREDTDVFCLVCFCFFSRSLLNKESNEPNNTSCPTDDTLLRPRRKTLCHDYREQNVQYI